MFFYLVQSPFLHLPKEADLYPLKACWMVSASAEWLHQEWFTLLPTVKVNQAREAKVPPGAQNLNSTWSESGEATKLDRFLQRGSHQGAPSRGAGNTTLPLGQDRS